MSAPRPPRIAVALEYDGQGAPRVTAKGRGELAERIVERQRMLEGGPEPAMAGGARHAPVLEAEPPLHSSARSRVWATLLTGLALILAGVLFGLGFSAVLFWDRISAVMFSS